MVLLFIGVTVTFSSLAIFAAMALGVMKLPIVVHKYLDWLVILGLTLIVAGGMVLWFNGYRSKRAHEQMRLNEHRESRSLFFEQAKKHREEREAAASSVNDGPVN